MSGIVKRAQGSLVRAGRVAGFTCQHELSPPRSETQTAGDGAFPLGGPSSWDFLPVRLRPQVPELLLPQFPLLTSGEKGTAFAPLSEGTRRGRGCGCFHSTCLWVPAPALPLGTGAPLGPQFPHLGKGCRGRPVTPVRQRAGVSASQRWPGLRAPPGLGFSACGVGLGGRGGLDMLRPPSGLSFLCRWWVPEPGPKRHSRSTMSPAIIGHLLCTRPALDLGAQPLV